MKITKSINKWLAHCDIFQIAALPVLVFILLFSHNFGSQNIIIGVVLPASGQGSQRGLSFKHGVELALRQINKDSDSNLKKLRVEFINNEGSAEKTALAAADLIYNKKAAALLGGFEKADSFILQRMCEQSHVVFLSPTCTHFALTRNNSEYTFRSVSDDILQFEALSEMSFKRFNIKKPAIIYDNELYGADSAAKYAETAALHGQKVCAAVSCGSQLFNFKRQLDFIKALYPDALVILTRPQTAAMILRQLREIGLDIPVIGGSPLASKQFLELAGVYSESVLTILPYNPRAGGTRADNFLSDFYDAFGVQADSEAAHGYEALNLIAGEIKNLSASKNSLKELLSQKHGWESIAGSGGFNAEQNQVRPAEPAVIKNQQVIQSGLEELF